MATTMEQFHEYAQLPAAEIRRVRFEEWRRNREAEEMQSLQPVVDEQKEIRRNLGWELR